MIFPFLTRQSTYEPFTLLSIERGIIASKRRGKIEEGCPHEEKSSNKPVNRHDEEDGFLIFTVRSDNLDEGEIIGCWFFQINYRFHLDYYEYYYLNSWQQKMSIQKYFNRKKQKFITFFTELKSTIEKVSLAVQLEIDRQYDVASQVLRESSDNIVEDQCRKMEKKETNTLIKIIQQICLDIKASIMNPAQFAYREISVSDFKSKIHQTPQKKEHKYLSNSRVNYQTEPKNGEVKVEREVRERKVQRSYSGTKMVQNYDICEKLDNKIELQARQLLQRSEKRKKQNESRKKLAKNIIGVESSSFSYNNQIAELLNHKSK